MLLAGCATDGGLGDREVLRGVDEPVRAEGRRIEADPVGYLREVKARCDALREYRCRFFRQERIGLVPKLTPLEEMRVSFRAEPLAVKFEWIDPERYDGYYYESVYAAGENEDMLVVRERRGVFPLPPMVRKVPPTLAVKVGRAKSPVTDFGMARMVERTLEPIDDPAIAADVTIRYEGVVMLDLIERPAHHLRIERPATDGWIHDHQDLYIDAATGLPAGTDLWLPGDRLDARYRYTEVETDVRFEDADFRLDEGHPTSRPAEESTRLSVLGSGSSPMSS